MSAPVDVPGTDKAQKGPNMMTMWPESWAEIAEVDQLHRSDRGRARDVDLSLREHAFADTDSLEELVRVSSAGTLQMVHLVTQWRRTQANAVHLRQQLESLDVQRLEAQRKYDEIVESQWANGMASNVTSLARLDIGDRSSCPMCDDECASGGSSSNNSSVGSVGATVPDNLENSMEFWRERCKKMETLLSASLQREQSLLAQLKEKSEQNASVVPMEELRESLIRVDNFLHFILQKAPIVIGHQDAELRHKFIYNPFPGLTREDFIGKIDTEINNGPGVEECMEFKREVLTRGKPMQKEFDLYSDLFGHKTFLLTVEPVVCKSGESLGINYMALDITEEAERREKLVVLREEAAVQKTLETELQRSIVVTEEAMRAKQMLATMSHEIRSPLSGVVSMAQILGTTKLDTEQRNMVEIMNSSGEHVLELINDILDLSKAESGLMKLEAKKFRPRLVVKRVLQLAQASVHNKSLALKPDVAKDVPEEVVGDVLRIRQVLTNLVSNAVKFTPKGEVIVTVRVAPPPPGAKDSKSVVSPPAAENSGSVPVSGDTNIAVATTLDSTTEALAAKLASGSKNESANMTYSRGYSRSTSSPSPLSTVKSLASALPDASTSSSKSVDDVKTGGEGEPLAAPTGLVWDISPKSFEQTEEIWLHYEVRDTGIGIPEAALPSLFDEYTQATSTTARKYGGTGLGLAICKQLVGIMGGKLEVTSKQDAGSSFSFALPLLAVRRPPTPPPTPTSRKDERSPNLGAGTERRADQEGKAKGVDGKLKQMLRDSKRSWINALGESALFGRIRSSVESLSPQIPSEGNEPAAHVLDNKTGSVDPECTSDGAQTTFGKESFTSSGSKKCPAHSHGGHAHAQAPATSALPPPEPELEPKPEPEPVAEEEAEPRPGPRLLMAEDNHVNVVVAQSMMKRLGHKLEVVHNGAEAVEALKRSSYDLVLMDVSMPVMDGLEATRLIRQFEESTDAEGSHDFQVPQNNAPAVSITSPDKVPGATHAATDELLLKRTPIIALTANAMAENVAECYHSGMDSFIAKPVTFDKLEQVLKQYIPWSDHSRIQSN